ncbi:hypothetical protein T10_8732 [Trichinella papuae]|uniref:Uncharacterized protein n=1 Tax=Trichinella papuae TaxID=268474 RepID=A0A0V1N0U5_9BILA|nr:hypothetical protein T10_8732 [Trichinella papuae]
MKCEFFLSKIRRRIKHLCSKEREKRPQGSAGIKLLRNAVIAGKVEQLLTIDDTALFGTLIEKDKNKEVGVSDEPNEGPCFKVSFNWLEQQKEFSATQLMLMRHIRNVAA